MQSVQIPPFWMDSLEILFFVAQFNINGIVSEETKFSYLVSQLEPKYVENIWDIVTTNSVTRHSESKTTLLDLFKESVSIRIKKKNLLMEFN